MTLLRESAIAEASELMLLFAARTGLGAALAPRRYLWTDAFAVCNFLGLARATGEKAHLDLAAQLVEQVHGVLGRHRGDDGRTGRLSGLDEEAARAHPTAGGLRIGKALPERRAGEPANDRLEWDRDGQYFHYLTRWMHALDQMSRATRDGRFNLWARELAAKAHAAFAAGAPARRLSWKMSIDLTRPLVSSMGQHDALDGLVTYAGLRATAQELGTEGQGPRLDGAMADFDAIVARQDLVTSDPLGTGGLLADAGRVAALMRRGGFPDGELLERMLAAALEGLQEYERIGEVGVGEPASHRLAFRELGLAIGHHGVRLAAEAAPRHARAATRTRLDEILRYAALGNAIRDFWVTPEHRMTALWREHEDINDVMLATCLAPAGYLVAIPMK